jgi:cell wall-associated NlpC family hydrolase
MTGGEEVLKRVLIIGLLVFSSALITAAPQKKSKRAKSHKSEVVRKSSSKRNRTATKSSKNRRERSEKVASNKRSKKSSQSSRTENRGTRTAQNRNPRRQAVAQTASYAKVREIARGRVTGVNINIRKSPSTSAPIVTKVTGGEVAILATQGDWLQLRFQYGSVGWVRKDFVAVYGNKLAKKSAPKPKATPVVASKVEEVEPEKDPASNGQTISLTNADLEENKASATPTSSKKYAMLSGDPVNVRRGPSTSNSVIRKVKGGKAEIVDKWGDWYKLKFEYGTVGWVRGDFLDIPGVARPKIAAQDYVASAPNGDKVDNVLKSADRFRGTRYVYGAASRGATDCSGFTLQVFRANGINLPRTAREQVKCGVRVSRGDLQAGDLVFFNTRGYVSHVGIYIGNNRFIHASSGQRKVTESSLSGYYSSRYITARRVIKGGTKLVLPKGGSDLSELEPSQQAAPGTDAIGE